jgi:hypothetical protein
VAIGVIQSLNKQEKKHTKSKNKISHTMVDEGKEKCIIMLLRHLISKQYGHIIRRT